MEQPRQDVCSVQSGRAALTHCRYAAQQWTMEQPRQDVCSVQSGRAALTYCPRQHSWRSLFRHASTIMRGKLCSIACAMKNKHSSAVLQAFVLCLFSAFWVAKDVLLPSGHVPCVFDAFWVAKHVFLPSGPGSSCCTLQLSLSFSFKLVFFLPPLEFIRSSVRVDMMVCYEL